MTRLLQHTCTAISNGTSPAPQPGAFGGTTSDSQAYIALDRDNAYVAWADWRPGDRHGFFSAVRLEAFSVGRRR